MTYTHLTFNCLLLDFLMQIVDFKRSSRSLLTLIILDADCWFWALVMHIVNFQRFLLLIWTFLIRLLTLSVSGAACCFWLFPEQIVFFERLIRRWLIYVVFQIKHCSSLKVPNSDCRFWTFLQQIVDNKRSWKNTRSLSVHDADTWFWTSLKHCVDCKSSIIRLLKQIEFFFRSCRNKLI